MLQHLAAVCIEQGVLVFLLDIAGTHVDRKQVQQMQLMLHV